MSNKYNLSFELYPPREWNNEQKNKYISLIKTLLKYKPKFISCTYGANGGNKSNVKKILHMIKQYGGVPMAHCTIANQEFIDVDAFIKDLIKNKINKILCLRGDTEGNFTKHASDLMEYIKKNYSKYFEMFGAYYPEKHNENKNQNISVEIKNNFGNKTAAGCQKFISQCFFDNNIFLSVVKKIKAKYPNVELYAGIFPLLKYKNLTNIQTMCNCDIPNNITKYFEEHKHDEASLYNFGIKNTIKQIKSLIAHNFKNIHIFTMANENAIIQIMKGVSKCSK